MPTLRYLAGCALLAAAYIAAGKVGLALAVVNASATPVWPCTGIAIAGALILGPRVWPVILAAAFAVNQTTAGSWSSSLLIAGGNTCEALVASYLVTRFANGRHVFNRVWDVFRFVVLAGLFSTMISAGVGVTALSIHGYASWSDYTSILVTWWLGDATGAIVFAPILLLWITNPRPGWSRWQLLEIVLLVVAASVVGWLVFIEAGRPITFLGIPLCIWTAFRFGQREASAVTGVLSAIALWGTVHGLGPFAVQSPNAALLSVQAFTAVAMIVGLVLGAAVSERKRVEDELEQRVASRTTALQASEARLAEAQEVAHIGSWEWDVANDYLWWSDELYRMYRVDRESFRPSYDAFLGSMHPDDRSVADGTVQQSLSRGDPFEFEFRLLRPDGEERTVLSKGRVISSANGRTTRMVGTGQDVTEQRQLEIQFRQAQKMEAVGLLAGGIAHDFNNLITAIVGYTELVLLTLDEADPRRADLMEVRKATDRAAALTWRLLAFSRRQTLQPTVLDLNALVGAIENLLRRTLGEHIELILDLDLEVAPIRADSGQLEQVLLNLALNARDAMSHGGQLRFATRVSVIDETWARRRPPMPAGRYVHLTVSDTGIGMSRETQARVFEPFFTTKPPGEGSGFGLATVYGIINQSSGYIWVTSQPGRGTSFDIYLPTVRHGITPDPPKPPAPAPEVSRGSETILLVEDDGAVRGLAHTVLRSSGYTVYDARDGEEALAIAQHRGGSVDLLITDVVMPGVSGRELAARLNLEYPVLRVLYTSGYSKEPTGGVGVEDSAPFLSKPFLPVDLLKKVREVLSAPGPERSVLLP